MRINHFREIMILVFALMASKCSSEAINKLITKEYLNESELIYRRNSYLDSLYFHNNAYVAKFTYNRSSILKAINGYLVSKPYGHYFKFDTHGTLESYEFRINDKRYSYQIYYNNDSSRYVEIGNPFVDYWKDESKNTDSTKNILCLLSTFPRQKIEVFVSFNGIDYNKVASKNSAIMPFLEEVELSLPINQQKFQLKIKSDHLIYNWKGLANQISFSDTVTI